MANGAQAGAVIAVLAALGHVAAGGRLPLVGAALGIGAVVAGCAVVGPSVRWTFGRILLAAFGVQAALHLVFSSAGHAGHAPHVHPEHAATVGSSSSMWIAHAAVAVVAAVALRWGWRWLRAMPGLVRAVLLGMRSLRAPFASSSSLLSSIVSVGTGHATVFTWRSRGPPAMA